MTAPAIPVVPEPPADWPQRYDRARSYGTPRPQALRYAVGVDEAGETRP